MDWNVMVQYLPQYEKAAWLTLRLGVAGIFWAILVGLVCAVLQYEKVPVLRRIVGAYIQLGRNTPLLVQLFVIFYGLPRLGVTLDAFPSAIIVFSINTGAYAAETMRAAILSVPKGQMEAGYCAGMTYPRIMTRIILPQAARTAFPPLSNSLIGLLKDTSLASNITIMEMFMSAQRIAARTYDSFALYCEVALIYLLFCTFLTKVQRICEKKLELN